MSVTCNVTALRCAVTLQVWTHPKAITLQVTDTIRSYELNLNPVPHGVTVSCERYTFGFPVCYGSPSDVFATSTGFVHLYILCFEEKRSGGGGKGNRTQAGKCTAAHVCWQKWMLSRSVGYTGCPRRNVRDFGRVFLMLNYTDITRNTYIQSWTVTEIIAREVWNFDSCYSLIDYQIHIETGRNVWFL